MMAIVLRFALAGLALAASVAQAQQAPATPSLRVVPDTTMTAPANAVRGFDAPQPALRLDAPVSGAVAGLAPGQDLVGKAPLELRAAAADTDSYFNTREYQDKAETIQRKGHPSIGQQFAGVGEAAASNLAIGGVSALISGN
jgi:hypothetical protein